jgi:hypothetical protein
VQEIEPQHDKSRHKEKEDETISGTGTSHGNGDSSETVAQASKECFAPLFTTIERKTKDSGRLSVVSGQLNPGTQRCAVAGFYWPLTTGY